MSGWFDPQWDAEPDEEFALLMAERDRQAEKAPLLPQPERVSEALLREEAA